MGQTATELGYASIEFGHIEAGKDYELVKVGEKTKRGDEYWTGRWEVLADKYLNLTVNANFRPVRRRMRWSCFHLRERLDKRCPVCIVFLRNVIDPL